MISGLFGDGDWQTADLARTVALDSRKSKLKMRAFVLLYLPQPSYTLAVGLLLEDLPLPALASARRRLVKDPGLHS